MPRAIDTFFLANRAHPQTKPPKLRAPRSNSLIPFTSIAKDPPRGRPIVEFIKSARAPGPGALLGECGPDVLDRRVVDAAHKGEISKKRS